VPFIAEDLGAVTPGVRKLRDQFDLPGMRVLQFAFGGDPQAASFLPYAYVRRSVAYTGTHDNDTIQGWFDDPGGEGSPRSAAQALAERKAAVAYLAGPESEHLAEPAHWAMIRAVYGSVADVAIIPLQDVLGLGTGARMNTPGKPTGNWEWRVPEGSLTTALSDRLRLLAVTYGRARIR
jgi:4-alpha-glucanotransferase